MQNQPQAGNWQNPQMGYAPSGQGYTGSYQGIDTGIGYATGSYQVTQNMVQRPAQGVPSPYAGYAQPYVDPQPSGPMQPLQAPAAFGAEQMNAINAGFYAQTSPDMAPQAGMTEQSVSREEPSVPQFPPTPQMNKVFTMEKRRSSRVIVWIFLGILVLSLLAGAYFLWFRPRAYTAESVVQALYRRGLPMVSAYNYTPETDPDGLLGTTYQSKAGWVDQSLASSGRSGVDAGGVVEVFRTQDDALLRLNELMAGNRTETGRCYQSHRVVMRLSTSLSSQEAALYEETLEDIFKK
ncbi:MAG: hypothetical protein IJ083_03685 [Clostridia bacterium]|nr:hypothetical protein [Clostridia bacterium]